MRTNSPPPLASWLLEHWAPGCDPSLCGDLDEQFHSGRGRRWYWRQTLHILAMEIGRDLPIRLLDMLFAFAWCALLPGWMQIVAAIDICFDVAAHLRQVPFPFSNLLTLALGFGSQIAFIWWGLALYLMMRTMLTRATKVRRVVRGLLWSVQIFIIATPCVAAVCLFLPKTGPSHPALGLLGQIASVDALIWLRRVPYILTFLCALWLLSYRSPGYRERSVS